MLYGMAFFTIAHCLLVLIGSIQFIVQWASSLLWFWNTILHWPASVLYFIIFLEYGSYQYNLFLNYALDRGKPSLIPVRECFKPMKETTGRIIDELKKKSSILLMEKVFKKRGRCVRVNQITNVCAKQYNIFLGQLRKHVPEAQLDIFASKLLEIIQSSKEKRVFRTQFLVFWIQLQCLLEDAYVPSSSEVRGYFSELINKVNNH